jgi:hypothetical protein
MTPIPLAPLRGNALLRSLMLPSIYFRTLNGFKFWPLELEPAEQETSALRVRRAFAILDPEGRLHRCAVDVTTPVRTLVAERLGAECPADHPLWDQLCRAALAQHLREQAEPPAENLLVYGLTREQLEAVRVTPTSTLP